MPRAEPRDAAIPPRKRKVAMTWSRFIEPSAVDAARERVCGGLLARGRASNAEAGSSAGSCGTSRPSNAALRIDWRSVPWKSLGNTVFALGGFHLVAGGFD